MGDFDLSFFSLLLLLFFIFSSFLASFAATFASFSAALTVLASISFLIFSISFLLLPPSLICPSLSYPLPVILAFLNLVSVLCLEHELSTIEGAKFEKGIVGRGEGDGVTFGYCSMLEPAEPWFLKPGDERVSG